MRTNRTMQLGRTADKTSNGESSWQVKIPSFNRCVVSAPDLTEREKSALAGMQHYNDWDSGYSKQQSTRPQTLGYGLADSPIGQAMWILEKFWSWTDCNGHPENVLTRDELLDNIMMYWLPDAAASSARLYWESFLEFFAGLSG